MHAGGEREKERARFAERRWNSARERERERERERGPSKERLVYVWLCVGRGDAMEINGDAVVDRARGLNAARGLKVLNRFLIFRVFLEERGGDFFFFFIMFDVLFSIGGYLMRRMVDD